MRDLIFNVNKQKLSRDDNCDFKNIIQGSKNYLNCVFVFNSDWNGCNKVVIFKDNNNEKPILLKNNRCLIPSEFSDSSNISLKLIGQKGEQRIVTNSINFVQVEEMEDRKKWKH